jgi:hypothetical protein
MNLSPWIDPRIRSVRPADAQAYLRRHGWKLQPFPQSQIQVFEGPADDAGEPIIQVVPLSEKASDYLQSIMDLVTALAAIEDRPAVDVLNDILQPAGPEQPSFPNGQGRDHDQVPSP